MVKRENICVVAHDATYGNAAELAKALQCKLTLFSEDPKGMHNIYPSERFIQQADEYILVGAYVLKDLKPNFYNNKKVKIILTDTTYRRDYRALNPIFKKHGWEVHAMPLFLKQANTDRVFYQPFNIDIPIKKNEEITVCHSPFSPLKFKQKGTLFISETVKKFDVNYDLIIGISQEAAIERRAKSHIFVDQMIYSPGKSAFEAMLTECLVMGGDNVYDIPIVHVAGDTLESKLRYYIDNHAAREEKITEQYRWAKRNLSYKAVIERLLG